MTPRIPDVTLLAAVNRVARGEPAAQVAASLRIGATTVLRACKRRGVAVAPQGNPDVAAAQRRAAEAAARRAEERRNGTAPKSTRVRARVESTKRMTKRELDRGAMEFPISEHPRAGHGKPKTRAACERRGLGTRRPCPYVSCKYHVAVEVTDAGSIKHAHPGLPVGEHKHTCTLALADKGGMTLEEVGAILNTTSERVRQIEGDALAKVRAALGDDADAFCAALAAGTLGDLLSPREAPPAPVLALPVTRRYLPVVRAEAPPERPALDAEARALAATRAPLLSPRTWERSAARRLP